MPFIVTWIIGKGPYFVTGFDFDVTAHNRKYKIVWY